MEGPNKLIEYFGAVLEQLPSLITLLGCMIFALIRWNRHPKVSLMVTISLSLLFLHGLVFAAVYNWVPGWFIRPGIYGNIESTIQRVYLVLGLIHNSTLALAFAVLLAAIFMQRKPVAQSY